MNDPAMYIPGSYIIRTKTTIKYKHPTGKIIIQEFHGEKLVKFCEWRLKSLLFWKYRIIKIFNSDPLQPTTYILEQRKFPK